MTTKTPVGEKYDLLLKGGRVIDPANGIDDFIDLAVAGKYVSKVAKDIPKTTARNVIDVTGLVVTPGLIDLHAHFYGITGAILPDAHCLSEGTTTAVDAGGAGPCGTGALPDGRGGDARSFCITSIGKYSFAGQ